MDSTKDLSGQTDTGKVKSQLHMKRSDLTELSCVSMKSDASMEKPIEFNVDHTSTGLRQLHMKRSDSLKPSCVSMKSDRSMDKLLHFKGEHTPTGLRQLHMKRSDSLKPSCVSMKSDRSMDKLLHFKGEHTPTGLSHSQHVEVQNTFKSNLLKKFQCLCEGTSKQENPTLLNEIYTELYITESERGEINNEHEVRQIEKQSRRAATEDTPIKCNDIFKPLPGQDKPIRTVLTKGVAGIGKTVSVQKFIVDWTEGKANQDVHIIFPLPFRELNLMKDKKLSLSDLLQVFFSETKEMEISRDEYKVFFIFDGLDECRLSLDFQSNVRLCDVTESASVDVLLTNLIKGNLLPSSLIWITSRPAAADLIPSECVDRVTEVRGFNDPQKEEYFRKRIRDQSMAKRIITHLKSSRSLFIMCHIPVFCWISATVLETMLSEADRGEIPKTLTQMYTHFLIIQTNIKHEKDYEKKSKNSDMILKLGKLAFKQLVKGNLIFYEEDLRKCGIDVTEASVYSGLCTQIFREEFGLYQGKVFCFVHLSIQEHLAALYAHLSFTNNNMNVFEQITKQRLFSKVLKLMKQVSMFDLHQTAVNETLKSKNGHLDLFLRFFLGLSLESNHTLLQELPTQTGSCSYNKEETVKYIKQKIRENQSPEKSINLFHCLNELGDDSLVKEIQDYLKSGKIKETKLSSSQWSAVVFVLLTSEQEMDVFDLKQFIGARNKADEVLQYLLPVIKESRSVHLMGCNLTKKSCSALASILSLNSSNLRELDLSNNDLRDSGVKLISDALKSPHCTLEILRFAACRFTDQCCESLSSVLQSSKSLRELDLSNNDLQDSGVKLLSDALKSPHCILETLRFAACRFTDQCCESLSSLLQSSKSLRELDLSNNDLQDSGVKLLSDALKSPHCILEILRFAACRFTVQCCGSLSSVLQSSKSLRELDLSNNDLQDSGVKLLSDALKSSHCTLEILRFAACRFTDQCCESLSSVLQSSKSLRELDLSNNDLQDSGVKLLSDALKSPHCSLEILRLSGCMMTEEGCCSVASALRSNLSHLKELDLSYNHPGESGVKLLSERLNDPNCTLDKLNVDHGGEFRITAGPRKYVCDLTLDSNTVHTGLILSEGNRKVTRVIDRQSYPDHPERFDVYPQVLCRDSLTGHCYWETQWSGRAAGISVSYKEISRKGRSDDCLFGFNVNSWSLICSNNTFTVRHNNNRTDIRPPSHDCKRVGVYVDCPAGTLSFYSVSDTHTLTHLHTLITTFTRPLYAGFRVFPDSSVCVCEIDHQRHTHTTG
ncbi:NACHT, LRR and PYD domains-containing protein 3-like isoform X2 [Xyrauchen texanus]|uniref:NACHT, LRR and PYD domains-containing protein 3-like isoform X2 n=1 Tax=Xyrauchen texanus TaxID=154827 RepID=UPI00224276D1|nr:NACHT, LRR and PYD domains-containing protein 3-like isoform X2 [Xyrauchen texanus]